MAKRFISGAVFLAMIAAVPAGAGMVSGGGSATSDCYAELDVLGVGADAVKRKKKVACVDGDACDSGPCGDGVCDFKVRLCWNQADPDNAACTPPPRLHSLQLRGQLAAVLIMPDDLDGAACSGDYVDFPVATRGVRRAGRMNIRFSAKAPDGHTPASDTDWIRLVCVPRSSEACPMPTPTVTTTTAVPGTTLPGETTTTTTAAETTTTRKTTTTRRRRTTTTTTAVPTTTTVRPTTTTVRPTTTTVVVPTTTVQPTTTFVLPTTLPTVTITLPASSTLALVTTTSNTTTTTRRRKRGDDDDREEHDD